MNFQYGSFAEEYRFFLKPRKVGIVYLNLVKVLNSWM